MNLINTIKGDIKMITTAKNRNELIEGLKKEKDFAVLATHTGIASVVAREIAKLANKQISVIVTVAK